MDVIGPLPWDRVLYLYWHKGHNSTWHILENIPVFGSCNWGHDKMSTMSQTTFSNIFVWWKKSHIISPRFVPRGPLTICRLWFRSWLGIDQVKRHCLNQWRLRLLTNICVTRPEWVNLFYNSKIWLLWLWLGRAQMMYTKFHNTRCCSKINTRLRNL